MALVIYIVCVANSCYWQVKFGYLVLYVNSIFAKNDKYGIVLHIYKK